MCGIAGQYQFEDSNLIFADLEKAVAHLVKRGPDGGGIFALDKIILGHRRLSIFDVTNRSSQPMIDNELGLALSFNGAIYNFIELKQELEQKGYKFNTTSDTEVILKAYDAWGLDFVQKLEGMFAFALFEKNTGRLIIVRDRMGIKPLYYAYNGKSIKFASTLPALLEFQDIDTSIDKIALHYYMTFHAIPEPRTILSGIKKLPPASMMIIEENGQVSCKNYWGLHRNDNLLAKHTEDYWLEKTENALKEAVGRQLRCDVPSGILLSGGLDSSLLVALAKESKENLETFSIGFESTAQEQGDEFYYSDMVAKHYNTKHHKIMISNQSLQDSLLDCVKAMSEPMTSHDNIGFYMLSGEVSKHVKVALSGQGADELFAGYHWFHNMPQGEMNNAELAQSLHFFLADHTYEEYLSATKEDYHLGNYGLRFLEDLCEYNQSPYAVDALLTYEASFALTNGPLCRVDNMTMASSLEARVPFLDELVVNTALEIPLEYHLKENGKHILKEISRRVLPSEVVDRPKGYFPVPALKYVQGDMFNFMKEVLSPESVKQRGIFKQEYIDNLFEKPHKNLTPLGASKLWQACLLEIWLQQHNL